MSPIVVRQAFDRLLPIWKLVDLAECERLEESRVAVGQRGSLDSHVQKVLSFWPESSASEYNSPNSVSQTLPIRNLSSASFRSFLRKIEALIIAERFAPVIVYWSSHTVASLLPSGQVFRELLRDCISLSLFSEDNPDSPNEWAFAMESQSLSLVVYGKAL
jgi:hypothetical protein